MAAVNRLKNDVEKRKDSKFVRDCKKAQEQAIMCIMANYDADSGWSRVGACYHDTLKEAFDRVQWALRRKKETHVANHEAKKVNWQVSTPDHIYDDRHCC